MSLNILKDVWDVKDLMLTFITFFKKVLLQISLSLYDKSSICNLDILVLSSLPTNLHTSPTVTNRRFVSLVWSLYGMFEIFEISRFVSMFTNLDIPDWQIFDLQPLHPCTNRRFVWDVWDVWDVMICMGRYRFVSQRCDFFISIDYF